MQQTAHAAVERLPARRSDWERASIAEGLERVEGLLAEVCLDGPGDALGGIVREHLDTGGKRLRARLALASVVALGGDLREGIPWAAACELLHNATLVHDDLQDGDRYRRGKPAVWVRHGAAQAVNAGDLLLMLPFLALDHLETSSKVKWRLARTLAARAAATVRGQAEEMALLPEGALGWAAYRRAIVGKTSALFRLPVEGAALLCGYHVAEAQQIAGAFQPLGVLFQLQDDVVDVYGDKGRDTPGSDLREGKVSALVVEHLARHPDDVEWLLGVLRAPRAATGDEDVARARDRFVRGGALEAVVARIDAEAAALQGDPVLARHPHLQSLVTEVVALVLAPLAAVREGVA